MLALRTRIAPTPSGLLHPGNGISFVMTWALARASQGTVLLRIDDLDKGRRRPEYLEDIFATLDWLGIDYDEGPSGVDDFLQNWSQHQRLDRYYEALAQLKEADHLFACDCTRKQIREESEAGLYPGRCQKRQLDFEQDGVAWRIKLEPSTKISFRDWHWGQRITDLNGNAGHFVVRQKNRMPAYQIASLVDDHDFKINFIVRGMDLLSSTAAQIHLARLLNWPRFSQVVFWHHPLKMNSRGQKLSKSKGASSLKFWREQQRSPQELYQQAAQWLGVKTTVTSPAELVEALRSNGVDQLNLLS